MTRKRKNNLPVNLNCAERTITCRYRRRNRSCSTKFSVEIGKKDYGYDRSVDCPKCGTKHTFHIDEDGKFHGPI